MTFKWFNYHNLVLNIVERNIKNFGNNYTLFSQLHLLITGNQDLLQQHESKRYTLLK